MGNLGIWVPYQVIIVIITQLLRIAILSTALLLLGKFLAKKGCSDRELQSPFECVFSTLRSHRMAFSLHFFLVALVFAIFDVEILLLFPALTEAHSSLKNHKHILWVNLSA